MLSVFARAIAGALLTVWVASCVWFVQVEDGEWAVGPAGVAFVRKSEYSIESGRATWMLTEVRGLHELVTQVTQPTPALRVGWRPGVEWTYSHFEEWEAADVQMNMSLLGKPPRISPVCTTTRRDNVPLWPLALPCLCWLLLSCLRAVRQRHRIKHTRCASCGYDSRRLVGPCPECGTAPMEDR